MESGVVTSIATREAAERRVLLAYAPSVGRAGMAALLGLDDAMAAVLRTTSEPMLGQIRLTWWHDAITALDRASPPAQPVLRALAGEVLPAVSGATLGRIVEGWEELLDSDVPNDDRLTAYAVGRGAGLFESIAAVLGGERVVPVSDAGRGWALADLASHTADVGLAARAATMAQPLLATAARQHWPRNLRSLGAMVHLARRPDAGEGRRIGRILVHRLTGL